MSLFHRLRLGATVSGVVLLVASLAQAQTAVPTSETEDKPETAKPAAAGDAVALDELVVTATRRPMQPLEVPATVSRITRRTLEEQGTRDIQDLVRYQTGVSVERTTSGTDPWHNLGGFTIRGVSGNRVQMQVDGARVIERITDGTRDFVDLPFIRAVEIQRGPGSVLWGADALGGIVAFETLNPDDLLKDPTKPYGGQVQLGYDSFDESFSKTGLFAYQLSPVLQALVGLNQRTFQEPELSNARADGGAWGCPASRYIDCATLDPLDGTKWNGLAKMVYRPDLDHEWKLTGEIYNSDTTVDQLYDYGVVSSGWQNGDYIRDQTLDRRRLALSHRWLIDSPWVEQLKWTVSFSPQKRQLDSERYQTNTTTSQVRRTDATLDYSEQFLQADAQLTSRFNLGGTAHILTYGFQADRTRTDYERVDVVTNLTTGVVTRTEAGGFNFANATTTRADLFLQDEVKLFGDRLTLTPGVRFANYWLDPRPEASYVLQAGFSPEKIDDHRLLPQIGAVLGLTETYSLYARYAQGFKMPTAQQLYTSVQDTMIPNPDLKPESVTSYEGGLRGKFHDGWFSVGGFYSDYSDFIQSFVPVEVNGDTYYTYRNLSSVRLWGLELSGAYQIHPDVLMNASATIQYGKQKASDGAAETYFDAARPFKGNLGAKWFLRDWNIDTEVQATFATPVRHASASTVYKPDGYTVLDAFVNWKPTKTLALRAGVMNIFDERYFQDLNGNYATTATESTARTNPLELQTAAGRTFKLSMTLDF